MLDDILELVLEIILEGVFDAAFSSKVPVPVRIILGTIVFVLLVGIIGLILWVGINSENVILVIISALLLVAYVVLLFRKIKEIKNRKRNE